MRVDCFHNSWVGSRLNVHLWLAMSCIITMSNNRIGRLMDERQFNYTLAIYYKFFKFNTAIKISLRFQSNFPYNS